MTTSGSMACRRSAIRWKGVELPKSVRKRMTYHRLSAPQPAPYPAAADAAAEDRRALSAGDHRAAAATAKGVIDWVLRAYEHDKAMPLPALLVLGPFMQSERQAEFLNRAAKLKKVEAITFDAQLETLMDARCRRRRHGRLQHLLRDPVLRQARAHHAAHQAAPWSSISAPPGPRSLASAGCWWRTAQDARAMATALRHLPQQQLPSQVVVPGLLDGQTNVDRLVDEWLARGRRPQLALAAGTPTGSLEAAPRHLRSALSGDYSPRPTPTLSGIQSDLTPRYPHVRHDSGFGRRSRQAGCRHRTRLPRPPPDAVGPRRFHAPGAFARRSGPGEAPLRRGRGAAPARSLRRSAARR